MSTWTDPDSGATIECRRVQRITETASLRAHETVDEIYLTDLRCLVERTAHIPGTAVVHADRGGIEITHMVAFGESAEEAPEFSAAWQQQIGGAQ